MRKTSRHQRGAATLVVVMILFFIMAMMAAYANRNLIFEQRIASNYYRSGVAVEAAEAGAEWAMTMLNGINVDAACRSDAGTPTNSFRDRYLTTDIEARNFTAATDADTGSVASCVRVADNRGWVCTCPATLPVVNATVAAATTMQPSFQVNLVYAVPGVISVRSTGCTGSDPSACVQGAAAAASAATQQLASAYVTVQAALVSALKAPPAAPLTLLNTISDGASRLGLHNVDPQGSGTLLLAGDSLPGGALDDARLDTIPGTPKRSGLISGDAGISGAGATPARFFAQFFGMHPAKYRTQPAVREAANCAAGCADADISALVASGARMIWVEGSLTLSGTGTFGSAAAPVVIVANGPVDLSGSVTINGLLYAAGGITANAPNIVVNGLVIGGAGLNVSGGLMDINYQPAIVKAISNGMGSFVKVPGSWWEGGTLP